MNGEMRIPCRFEGMKNYGGTRRRYDMIFATVVHSKFE